MFTVRNNRAPFRKRNMAGAITAILVAGGVALTGGAASASTDVTPSGQQSIARAIPACSKAPLFSHGSYEAGRLPASDTLSRKCELRLGDRGPGVRTLQRALNLCHGEKLVVNGRYGATTVAAVKRRQLEADTTANGIYGESTMLGTKFPLIYLSDPKPFSCHPGSHFQNNGWWLNAN